MRVLLALALALALGGCGSGGGGGAKSGRTSISISDQAMKARVAALADCPSPLTRLGIGRIQPRVEAFDDGSVNIVVPSSEDADGSRIHFVLTPMVGSEPTRLEVSWSVAVSGKAEELDLGEDRLLNPARIEDDLGKAVDQYVDYYYMLGVNQGASPNRQSLIASCNKIGRLLDAAAVTTNPALARKVASQKGREALGWLFQDNFRLGREHGDAWDNSDYDPSWEN